MIVTLYFEKDIQKEIRYEEQFNRSVTSTRQAQVWGLEYGKLMATFNQERVVVDIPGIGIMVVSP